jgi:hypothetical protein
MENFMSRASKLICFAALIGCFSALTLLFPWVVTPSSSHEVGAIMQPPAAAQTSLLNDSFTSQAKSPSSPDRHAPDGRWLLLLLLGIFAAWAVVAFAAWDKLGLPVHTATPEFPAQDGRAERNGEWMAAEAELARLGPVTETRSSVARAA